MEKNHFTHVVEFIVTPQKLSQPKTLHFDVRRFFTIIAPINTNTFYDALQAFL